MTDLEPAIADRSRITRATCAWFAVHARPLPWRSDSTSPWGVLVSEYMLQQTQVARVEPIWQHWLERWPSPCDLAAERADTVVRAWGRLGYPRRARWLHQAAAALCAEHVGQVPDDQAALLQLPGIGEYTSAAVVSFAFGRRAVVMDTNIRRVLVRAVSGHASAGPAPTPAQRAIAEAMLPRSSAVAARWNAAVMELGAVVCTARNPACQQCPIRTWCAWRAAGYPPAPEPARRQAAFAGSDRQVRGKILAILLDQDHASLDQLATTCPDRVQFARAVQSLIDDRLIEGSPDDQMRLAQ